MEIKPTLHLKKNNNLNLKKIVDFKKELDVDNINKNYNYILDYGSNPTIENYKIFLPYLKIIKSGDFVPRNAGSWGAAAPRKDDLVYHLRAGDTLLCG